MSDTKDLMALGQRFPLLLGLAFHLAPDDADPEGVPEGVPPYFVHPRRHRQKRK